MVDVAGQQEGKRGVVGLQPGQIVHAETGKCHVARSFPLHLSPRMNLSSRVHLSP